MARGKRKRVESDDGDRNGSEQRGLLPFMPPETWNVVCTFLEVGDLWRLRCASSAFRALIGDFVKRLNRPGVMWKEYLYQSCFHGIGPGCRDCRGKRRLHPEQVRRLGDWPVMLNITATTDNVSRYRLDNMASLSRNFQVIHWKQNIPHFAYNRPTIYKDKTVILGTEALDGLFVDEGYYWGEPGNPPPLPSQDIVFPGARRIVFQPGSSFSDDPYEQNTRLHWEPAAELVYDLRQLFESSSWWSAPRASASSITLFAPIRCEELFFGFYSTPNDPTPLPPLRLKIFCSGSGYIRLDLHDDIKCAPLYIELRGPGRAPKLSVYIYESGVENWAPPVHIRCTRDVTGDMHHTVNYCQYEPNTTVMKDVASIEIID